MSFTPRQHELLLNSCYRDPRLPEYLERILVEGPGDYDWPPAPGQYDPEEFPLWERISAQIWHQGTIYPASYVAVPVLCEVVARFPERDHAKLLALLLLIERSRPYFEPLVKPDLDAADLNAYQTGLTGLLAHLPAQLRMQNDSTAHGFAYVQDILSLMAYAAGQQWAARVICSHEPLIDHHTGEFAPALGRHDLPSNLRAEWQEWWKRFNAQQEVPFEDLDF